MGRPKKYNYYGVDESLCACEDCRVKRPESIARQRAAGFKPETLDQKKSRLARAAVGKKRNGDLSDRLITARMGD